MKFPVTIPPPPSSPRSHFWLCSPTIIIIKYWTAFNQFLVKQSSRMDKRLLILAKIWRVRGLTSIIYFRRDSFCNIIKRQMFCINLCKRVIDSRNEMWAKFAVGTCYTTRYSYLIKTRRGENIPSWSSSRHRETKKINKMVDRIEFRNINIHENSVMLI